jgi:hypothetical protein
MSALPTETARPANPALAAALQRLALSRAGLRSVLIAPPDVDDNLDGAAPTRLLRQLWRQLRRATRTSPVADLALGALQAWWLTRPWRPAVAELRHKLEGSVLPLVRRHPWAAVGVAAGAGAALVYLRPWRWVAARGSWPLWRAGLVAQAVQQAAKLPWEAMLGALMAGLATRQAAATPTPPPSPASPTSASASPPPSGPASAEHAPKASTG